VEAPYPSLELSSAGADEGRHSRVSDWSVWLPLQSRASELVTRTIPAVINWRFGCRSSPGRQNWSHGPYCMHPTASLSLASFAFLAASSQGLTIVHFISLN
jgi:hypothetical protein